MKTRLFAAVSAVAIASLSAPVIAQMNMPGMAMPMAEKAHVKKVTKKVAKKTATRKKRTAQKKRARLKPASHEHRPAMGNMQMPMDRGSMTMPMPAQPAPTGQAPMSMDQSQVQSGAMAMPMPAQPQAGGKMEMKMPSQSGPGEMAAPMDNMSGHGTHTMQMTGALGAYPEQRESSGTAWEPDASQQMGGVALMTGDWMLMAHGTVNLVYDHQSGQRGDDKTFTNGMLMGMARRPLGNGTVQFRAMLSPDPLMGPAGYPLLLATGETANGTTPLVDRQHPHDLFMEMSASVSQNIGPDNSVFIYVGLPGEPAFGPPAFMHRESILDSPEAPITHHWLDSTHISFGVVTAGLVLDRFKIEASRFNAREPDQHRWDIETGPLDSTSVRISWNPTRTLALQGSWGRFKDPEQLEPGVDQTRWSASALWADDIAPGWHGAATLAWGRKSSEEHNDDGVAAEASLKHNGWTVFSRGEWVENRELLGLIPTPGYRVGKVSLGAVRDIQVADHMAVGTGALFSLNFVPDALAPFYGSHNPTAVMGFVRLKLN